jgi:hypothetical protein
MGRKTQKLNQALLNIITPLGLHIKRNMIEIGDNLARAYGVIKYPQNLEVGWLAKLTNIPGTVANISFRPVDNSTLVGAISKSITQNLVTADSARDALTRQRAEKAAADGEKIMRQIDQHGETVGLMGVTLMPLVTDDKALTKVVRRMESAVSVQKCKIRCLANLQTDALKHISPSYPINEKVAAVIERIVPLSTFVGGFPFASTGFNDGTGYYLGKDLMGGLVVVDTWKRGGDRTNSNMVITGVAGVGKSTAVKHIAISEYMKGTKLIFIDPESEYKDLCQALCGDWINAAGGRGGRLNPLQIRPAPLDDDHEEGQQLYRDEGQGMGDMALHMKNLEIFFRLYMPELSDLQMALLKICLVELYNSKKIFWDTDVSLLDNADFPIFSDLYALIQEKAQSEAATYGGLALLLHDIAEGSDSFIWNGHTTVETSTRCICLDTSALQSTGDNIKRTQYFNLLSWCWEQMSRDRAEKVLLICDEAYLMIDPQVPQSLVFLRNIEKRSRKYEAAMAIVSHSIVDFLSPEVKMYGQALLDIPCLKILMGTDGQNLIETKKLYNLTDAEEELLAAKKREHALFLIGSKRMRLHFAIPAYKFDYMGGAGGR